MDWQAISHDAVDPVDVKFICLVFITRRDAVRFLGVQVGAGHAYVRWGLRMFADDYHHYHIFELSIL